MDQGVNDLPETSMQCDNAQEIDNAATGTDLEVPPAVEKPSTCDLELLLPETPAVEAMDTVQVPDNETEVPPVAEDLFKLDLDLPETNAVEPMDTVQVLSEKPEESSSSKEDLPIEELKIAEMGTENPKDAAVDELRSVENKEIAPSIEENAQNEDSHLSDHVNSPTEKEQDENTDKDEIDKDKTDKGDDERNKDETEKVSDEKVLETDDENPKSNAELLESDSMDAQTQIEEVNCTETQRPTDTGTTEADESPIDEMDVSMQDTNSQGIDPITSNEGQEDKVQPEETMMMEENSLDLPPVEEVDPFESTANEKPPSEENNGQSCQEDEPAGDEMISEPDQGMVDELANTGNSETNHQQSKLEKALKTNNLNEKSGAEKHVIKLKPPQFLMDPVSKNSSTAIATEESILPEEQDKDDKYVIIHASIEDDVKCAICNESKKALYVAQKDTGDSSNLCSNECLEKFKDDNPEKYIERMIRLRAFAQEPEVQETSSEELPPLYQFEEEKDSETSIDPMRKCKTCSLPLDLDSYVSWEAHDFCNEGCLMAFQDTINDECACCKKSVPQHLLGKYCVRFGTTITQFCRTTCLLTHKKRTKFCAYCQENLHVPTTGDKAYCSKRCAEVGNPDPKRMLESKFCAVCHQLKIVEFKVKMDDRIDAICSDRCFVAFKFVNNCLEIVKCIQCPTYFEQANADSIIYDGRLLYLICSKECQKIFLISNRKIVNCANCSVKKYDFDMIKCYDMNKTTFSCSLHCLDEYHEKTYDEQVLKSEPNMVHLEVIARDSDFSIDGKSLIDVIKCTGKDSVGKNPMHKITITRPKALPRMKNMSTMCKPHMATKSIQVRNKLIMKSVQTDDTATATIPIPVPIFVPVPLHMYATYVPMPTPIPIPLPVPIFIPTGRKSMKGIAKEIQKIKNRIPADPLEAEILMMADHAAGRDKKEVSSSESEDEQVEAPTRVIAEDPTAAMDTSMDASTSFGDDVLSMALNQLTTELVEPVDLEGVVDHSTITSSSSASKMVQVMETKRKEMSRQRHMMKTGRGMQNMEADKPDADMVLKYTLGVNAWKQWATLKNLELQRTQRKGGKFVKTEILHLPAEELSAALCCFIKEVRKPNGAEYAPDTIYYLCLGIQQYLYENGRIDNLFCDPFYDKFTEVFNDVCLKFARIYDDSQHIVTRVEEEHLWESRQLGAHSPLVLLNTLMFFNTKHFNLTTVDEHLQLSFSHIMKHWKRNQNPPNKRNVLLRFYPPHNPEHGKKRRVYEQQEYFANPLRCPVRLYEFYMSKCPESVKTRSDVFYLQPERSCVPDSPVWYSTIPFGRDNLDRMLNRTKMIKEINVALMAT